MTICPFCHVDLTAPATICDGCLADWVADDERYDSVNPLAGDPFEEGPAWAN